MVFNKYPIYSWNKKIKLSGQIIKQNALNYWAEVTFKNVVG